MTHTVTIAPVRKSVIVAASQELAFETFTMRIGRWWPKGFGVGDSKLKDVQIEPRVGGRVYEIDEDDGQVDWGIVLAWEPYGRLVFSWQITSAWKPSPHADARVHSEVEVRFVRQDSTSTRVELEHRHFERMGSEAGGSMRKDVDGGWLGLMEAYAALVGGALQVEPAK